MSRRRQFLAHVLHQQIFKNHKKDSQSQVFPRSLLVWARSRATLWLGRRHHDFPGTKRQRQARTLKFRRRLGQNQDRGWRLGELRMRWIDRCSRYLFLRQR